MDFSGNSIQWKPDEDTPVYPFFINEAAYYEKDTAFTLAKQLTIEFPASFVNL
jgi:hypothetical protein